MLVNFHREWHLVYPALRSVGLAIQEAQRKGVLCRAIAVIDSGDEATRAQVRRFAGEIDIHEVECANLSLARNYGIQKIDTRYFATLDGDDLFDRDWLWKGVQYLEELHDDRTVGHPQIRLTFGSDYLGRLHLPSNSPLFHPLNLITSWQYAADIIAPTELYRKYPQIPNDHEHGLGGEDWFWTCESLVNDIHHVIIPETVSYYRRQSSNLSLGMVPGITFHPTRLLDKSMVDALARDTESPAAKLLADSLDSDSGPVRRWQILPDWLKESVLRTGGVDTEIYDLNRALPTIPIETPPSYPGVNHLYVKLMGLIETGRPLMVVICDHLSSDARATMKAFFAAHKDKGLSAPEILIISLTSGKPSKKDKTPPDLPDNIGPGLRHAALGHEPAFARLWEAHQFSLIVRFLMQVRPDLTINLDSESFDRLMGLWGRSIAASPARTLRLCHGDDDDTLAGWQALSSANGHYSMALCRTSRIARRLNQYFNGTGLSFYACTDPSPGTDPSSAFGKALSALFASFSGHSQVTPVTDLPTFHMSHQPSSAPPDISCVLTVQAEGHHLNQTLRSIAALCADASRNNISTELIIVADHAGARTKAVLSSLSHTWPEARIIATALNHEGAVRNAGVAAAAGRRVALFSGTDTLSPDWLTRAVRLADKEGSDAIIHPHAVVEYGENLQITYQPDMTECANCIEGLASMEVWISTALADRELFLRHPYHTLPTHTGFGHVTRHWNCETVMAGKRHLIVTGSIVFKRPSGFAGEYRKRLGLQSEMALPPSRFFTAHPWLVRKAKKRERWQKQVEMAAAKALSVTMGFLRSRTVALRTIPDAWDEDAYLTASGDVQKAVIAGFFPSGYVHYCRHGHAEGRPVGWKTDHLFEAMRALTPINPSLAGAAIEATDVMTKTFFATASAYRSCRQIITEAQATHIFIAASLRPGGAELAMIHAIEAVVARTENRVLVITTENSDKRWHHRLPERCTWLPFAGLAADLLHEEQMAILTQLLINSGARCLHVVHSLLAWQVLQRHAPALAHPLRIYNSLFSLPPPESGFDVGPSKYIRAIYPYLSGILTDNRTMAAQLQNVLGVPAEKIAVLHHPVNARQRIAEQSRTGRPVLWAARLDHDKRPELLMEIARRLPAITFHAYGEPVLNGHGYLDQLREVPNIVYRGAFNGFDSIPEEPYLCFLHTTYWEGLPNIVLEAMKAGLLVIAPDVGGIAEVVGSESGVLIPDCNSVDDYVAALEKICADPESHRKLADNGRRLIAENFTHTVFHKELSAIPGYL